MNYSMFSVLNTVCSIHIDLKASTILSGIRWLINPIIKTSNIYINECKTRAICGSALSHTPTKDIDNPHSSNKPRAILNSLKVCSLFTDQIKVNREQVLNTIENGDPLR